MRFITIPSYTPHRIAFRLAPSALRLPPKGGVIPSLVGWGLMTNPGIGAFSTAPNKGGWRGRLLSRGAVRVPADAGTTVKTERRADTWVRPYGRRSEGCAGRTYLGLLKNPREAILSCAHAFDFTPPLRGAGRQTRERKYSPLEGRASRGESPTKRPSLWRRPIRWGVKRVLSPFRIIPPTGAASDSVLALPTPPQGGSDFHSRRSVTYGKSKNRDFFNNPVFGEPACRP